MKYLIRHKTNNIIKRVSDFPISFISAPGGFGKTTCLNTYLDTLKIHRAYFSLFDCLDERWAFSKIINTLAHQLGVPLDSHIPKDRHELEFFIGAIEAARTLPVYLILDDVTLEHTPMIMKMIQNFSFAPSSQIHFIIVTRESILDSLYTFCVARCFTMDYQDFSMNEEEIEQLCIAEDLLLSPTQIHSLFTLTKGWILAIQLVLQSYKKTKLLFCASPIESLLRNVLWNTLDPDVQTCLMKLSILNEFTLEQAIDLGYDLASLAAISQLAREQFFIQVPGPSTYRIVPIFKEFLHKELLLSPINITQLYQSNALWLLSKKQPIDAITMFLKCKDFDHILQILDDYKEISFVDVAPTTMMQVYTMLPDAYKTKYPQLYFRWVCDCITNLPQLDGHALLEDLKQRIDAHQLPGTQDYLLGEYHYICAFTQFNDVAKMFEHFVKAYHYFNGGTSLAVSPLMTATFGSYHVAFLYYNKIGNYRKTIEIITENIKYFVHVAQGINEGSESQVLAEYAFDTANYGDVLSHAIHAYNRAMKFKQLSVAVASLFIQGRYALLHFDTASFKLLEKKLLQMDASHRSLPILHSEIECALAHLHILNNECDQVPEWLKKGDFSHSKILHEASLIPVLVHGLYLVKVQHYDALHQLTDYIEENNPHQMFAYATLYATLFKVVLSYNYENSKYDPSCFDLLLQMCEQDHIISPVVEVSFAFEPLLHIHTIKNAFEQELMTRCLEYNEQMRSRLARHNLLTKLTKKEIAVLAKVAENKKLKEIALELEISPNTVQTHLKSIYRKLSVNTKVEAIRYYEAHLNQC